MPKSTEHQDQDPLPIEWELLPRLNNVAFDFSKPVTWDIETGPQPLDVLERLYPGPDEKKIPKHPGPFDVSSVKIPSSWGEEAAAKKIATEKEKHDKALKGHEGAVEAFVKQEFADFRDKAALSAIYGRVLAMGFLQDDQAFIIGADDEDQERELLTDFWETYKQFRNSQEIITGFNITGFDVPFVMRRSWILGIGVPAGVLKNNRYLELPFNDQRTTWSCGEHQAKGKVQEIALALGLPGKHKGKGGEEFANDWFSDRDEACKYLAMDVYNEREIGVAIGVI